MDNLTSSDKQLITNDTKQTTVEQQTTVENVKEIPKDTKSISDLTKENFPFSTCNVIFTSKLGSGTYGNVYSIYNKNTNTFYAVKDYIDLDEYFITDLNEIDILFRLKHPNLMSGVSFLLQGPYCKVESLGIVLPLGTTSLYNFIRFGNAIYDKKINNINTIDEIQKRIAFQMASALHYLHSKQILHLDIKPENIILSGPIENPALAILSDYGLSLYLINKEYVLDDTLRITLKYRAPEIITEQLNKFVYSEDKMPEDVYIKYRPQADIYSLGIVFLQLYSLEYNIFTINGKQLSQYTPLTLGEFIQHNLIDPTQRLQFINNLLQNKNIDNKTQLIDLLMNMLEPDYQKRFLIKDVISHPYFSDQTVIPGIEKYQPIKPIMKDLDIHEKIVENIHTSLHDSDLPLVILFTLTDLYYRIVSRYYEWENIFQNESKENSQDKQNINFYKNVNEIFKTTNLEKTKKNLFKIFITICYFISLKLFGFYYLADYTDLSEATGLSTENLQQLEILFITEFSGILYQKSIFTISNNITQLIEFYPYLLQVDQYTSVNLSQWINDHPAQNDNSKSTMINEFFEMLNPKEESIDE
jgi:serine/threonine protein kinase